MSRDLPQRTSRARFNALLIANAATRPLPNVVLPVALGAAGLLVGIGVWALVIALIAWVALAGITYFDEDEADKVARRLQERRRAELHAADRVEPHELPERIRALVYAAEGESERIHWSVDDSDDATLRDVADEVDDLMRALRSAARRAAVLDGALSDTPTWRLKRRIGDLEKGLERFDEEGRARVLAALRAQLEALSALERQLEGFFVRMEEIVAALGTIRARVLQIGSVPDTAVERELVREVRDLQQEVGAMADGMSEAYARSGVESD